MMYPIPKRYIRHVADKSRCSLVPDVEMELALDWLREQIIAEREEAAMSADD